MARARLTSLTCRVTCSAQLCVNFAQFVDGYRSSAMTRTQAPRRFFRSVIALWLLILATVTVGPGALGQTTEQLETFRNLSPEQQRAILEAMQGSDRSRADQPLTSPQTVLPRRVDTTPLERIGQPGSEQLQLDPRIQPHDTIVLDLELIRFEDQRQSLQGRTPSPGPGMPVPATATRETESRGQPNQATAPTPPAVRQPVVRTEEDTERLKSFEQRVERRNPYRLDKWGILNVPELGPIPLAGLTVEQAQIRLAAEGALREFVLRVTRLPLQPIGIEALRPFGYDLFAGIPSTFAPATDIPVPAEYVIGPGDVLEVQLIGNTRGRYSLVVGRDGRVDFPMLGPVAVGGRRFVEVREDLQARVRDQLIGVEASISIGELRSIRIFVLGDAQVPGSYTVSGLSTMTHALFVSGGVKEIGSLRKIELKRNGRTVSTLDLYDLLLRGDTSADQRLQPGDVVFIPPVGVTVSIAGEVRRPAIYEINGETTAQEIIALAGGLTSKADVTKATLERIDESLRRITLDLDLTSTTAQRLSLRAGDVIQIPAIRPILENSVTLSGHVYRPGHFEFRPGMRILDLISSPDELKPNADQRYVLVRRELPPDHRTAVFSANLEQAFSDPTSAGNFELAPRDEIHVFDLESGRDRVIEPILRELRLRSQLDEPTREVSITGQVKIPGVYPLEPGMRLTDAIRAGGGLSEAAYGGVAEVTRYTVDEQDNARRAQLIEIDLLAALNGDPSANIPLQPFDQIVIKEVPLWASQEMVEVRGEVRFPGKYPIKRGETLSSLLRRAGGLTDYAFPEGAVFTRRELQAREEAQLEMLAKRMQSDLAQLSLHAAQEGSRDAEDALAVGQSLLANLRSTTAVGRLVIDLPAAMNAPPGSQDEIILKDGDRLLVPRITQEVTVIGEVQSTTSHLYNPRLSRADYIDMSGGFTPRADKDRVYVVRANGSVEVERGRAWFSGKGPDVRPGDTIVVPLDTERMRPLPFWTAVTQIVYHLAVSVAAVNSF